MGFVWKKVATIFGFVVATNYFCCTKCSYMSKTKPIGVRFDEELLKDLKEGHGIDSPQKALNFLTDYFYQKPNRNESKKEEPVVKEKIVENWFEGSPAIIYEITDDIKEPIKDTNYYDNIIAKMSNPEKGEDLIIEIYESTLLKLWQKQLLQQKLNKKFEFYQK